MMRRLLMRIYRLKHKSFPAEILAENQSSDVKEPTSLKYSLKFPLKTQEFLFLKVAI